MNNKNASIGEPYQTQVAHNPNHVLGTTELMHMAIDQVLAKTKKIDGTIGAITLTVNRNDKGPTVSARVSVRQYIFVTVGNE